MNETVNRAKQLSTRSEKITGNRSKTLNPGGMNVPNKRHLRYFRISQNLRFENINYWTLM